eukprot:scaffold203_cov386-Prasinococcus_capsulatus_cf.AAC.18
MRPGPRGGVGDQPGGPYRLHSPGQTAGLVRKRVVPVGVNGVAILADTRVASDRPAEQATSSWARGRQCFHHDSHRWQFRLRAALGPTARFDGIGTCRGTRRLFIHTPAPA